MQTADICTVNKTFNEAMKDEFLWHLLLKEHSSFIEFVVAAGSSPFDTAADSSAVQPFHGGSSGAAVQPPPAPPVLAKQASGATASRHGSNEAAVVTVPAPVPGIAAATPSSSWGTWSARRAYRHILAARRARVVSWVAPHDALLAFPGARIPRPFTMASYKVLCANTNGNSDVLGDAPAAREGSAMASLMGRYSITFGGWAVGSPVTRNDLHVRCLMDPWPCEPEQYTDTLTHAIRKLHRVKRDTYNPWSVLVAAPPRVYDGWVCGTTAFEYREYLAKVARRERQAKRPTGSSAVGGSSPAAEMESLEYTGPDLDQATDPKSSGDWGGPTHGLGEWGGWEEGLPSTPCHPHGSAVVVRGHVPRGRYGHTLTNVMLPDIPGSDPEAKAEAAAAPASAAAGAGAGSASPTDKPHCTREALVMVGGLLQGGYSGETSDVWCLEVEREELTQLDSAMLDRVKHGERTNLKHHVFDRRRLGATAAEGRYYDYDRYDDEYEVLEEDFEPKGEGWEDPDQFMPNEPPTSGDIHAFGQVVTPYRLHVRWHRVTLLAAAPSAEVQPGVTPAAEDDLLARGYHSAAFDNEGGYLYVFGGFNDSENTASLQRIRVGMPGNPWLVQDVPGVGSGPCARFGAAMHVMGAKGGKKRLWVVGGGAGSDLMRDGHEIRDLHALDLQTMVWQQVLWRTSIPQGMPVTASLAVEEAAQHTSLQAAMQPVVVLPPPAWLGRCLSSVALDDDRILVFGGCAESVRNMAVIQCDVPMQAAPEVNQVHFDWYTPVQVMPHNTAFPSTQGLQPFARQEVDKTVNLFSNPTTALQRSQPFFNCNDKGLEAVKGPWAGHKYADGQPKALVRAPLYANPFAMPRIQSARATRVGRHVHVFGGWTNTQTQWEGMLLLAPHEGRPGDAAPLVQPAPSSDAHTAVALEEEFSSAAAPEAEEPNPELLSAQLQDAVLAARGREGECYPKDCRGYLGEVVLGSACGQPLGVWPPGRLAGPADSMWVLSSTNMHSMCAMEERGPFWLDGGRTGQRTREKLLQRQDVGDVAICDMVVWGKVGEHAVRFADSLGNWAQRRRSVPTLRVLGGPYGEDRQTAAADREGSTDRYAQRRQAQQGGGMETMMGLMQMMQARAAEAAGGDPQAQQAMQLQMLMQLAASGALRGLGGDDSEEEDEVGFGW